MGLREGQPLELIQDWMPGLSVCMSLGVVDSIDAAAEAISESPRRITE